MAPPSQGSSSLTTEPLRLTGEPLCPDCRIALSPIATLGHPNDRASVQPDAAVAGCMVATVGDSTYLVAGVVGGGEILVYEHGREATSFIGRRGAGPGEFGSNLRILTAGDTIIVVDNSNARIVMLNLAGDVLQSFQLPIRVNSVARLPDGHYVLHARLSAGPEQPVIRLVDESGNDVASLGRSSQEAWDTDQWVVSRGTSADFWAASMWDYTIFRGSTDSLAPAVIREVDWFPGDNVWSEEILETIPAPPLIMYLHETDEHLLWVYVAVSDPDWAPGMPDAGSAGWFRDSFDTMIEVIDLNEGTVVASHRADDYLGGICGTRLVYAVTAGNDGHVTVSVFDPRLER